MELRPVDAKPQADERDLLVAFLQEQRAAILEKVDGLTDEAAQRRLVPSLTNLVGMVNHLAGVERWWFRVVFAGEDDVPLPWTQEDLDADWKAEGIPLARAVADYRTASAEADAVVAGASLDDVAARRNRRPVPPSLRWILLHMIEETARHAGHADILREQLDGGA